MIFFTLARDIPKWPAAARSLTRLVTMAAGSADMVFDLIRCHAIASDAQQSGWIQPSHSDAALAKAQDRVRQWLALQRPVEMLDADAVTSLTGGTGVARRLDRPFPGGC